MRKLYLLAAVLAATANMPETRAASLYTFGGEAVSNSLTDVHSRAWGVEQETPTQYGLWDFGYMNEGHQNGDKRDGIYALREFDYQFTQRVTTSFAAGPYFTATTQTNPNGYNYQDHYSWAGLAAASAKYQINTNWSVAARWAHVLYAVHNKDADIFLIGIGYSPTNW